MVGGWKGGRDTSSKKRKIPVLYVEEQEKEKEASREDTRPYCGLFS
jgi:hypothetical protein